MSIAQVLKCYAPSQVISLLIPFFRIGFCSTSLIFMLAYVWSKNFATQNVSLYGLLTVQARWFLRPERLSTFGYVFAYVQSLLAVTQLVEGLYEVPHDALGHTSAAAPPEGSDYA